VGRRDALHPAASRAVRAERARHALAISAITYAEILVGPLRAGPDAVAIVERFAAQTRILDVSPSIAPWPPSCGRPAASGCPTP
jgi:predicted nucleic acid-binding protein